ncbi:MAG: hypothetical protein H0W01_11390 [Pseudonocardiales bacterium]|nr:hypothetical protein [Pseudonocardiales bacterium]
MADTCRCHLPFDPPVGPHWWPSRDPEPATTVRTVALAGQDPAFLRAERDAAGWRTEGLGAAYPESTPARGWGDVGHCWDGVEHAVVDVTPRGPT